MDLKNIIEHPRTVEEAANRLLAILSDAELQEIKSIDLMILHFSLGRDIRNAFGLNSDNTVLLGDRCADDVSGDIIEALWGKL